jgi:hypothetical protein
VATVPAGGLKWLKEENAEDADDLPEPEELAAEAVAELQGLRLLGQEGTA